MFKHPTWMIVAMLMMPIAAKGQSQTISFPPQAPGAPDRDAAPNERLNRSVRILRTTNKAQINRYVPKAYAFNNVNPFDVRFARSIDVTS